MSFIGDWIDGIKEKVVTQYAASAVRHLLSAAGGALVSLGVLSPDTLNQFVDTNSVVLIGLISYLVAQYFSVKKIK